MATSAPATTPEAFTSFGALLRFLRVRAQFSQRELAVAIGYSTGQISRLEQGQRLPDLDVVRGRIIPALELADDPVWAARLLELAAQA